jgi:DNA-binding NtrC family response regulator
VSLYLPAVKGEQERAGDERPKSEPPRSGTILLVDDEKIILTSTRRLLERLGYTVLVAGGGRDAVACYRESGERIALVILDLVMPDMDGEETFEALKEIDPEVRVVFSSGYSHDKRVEQLVRSGRTGFIQKPFDSRVLSSTIKRALEKNGA